MKNTCMIYKCHKEYEVSKPKNDTGLYPACLTRLNKKDMERWERQQKYKVKNTSVRDGTSKLDFIYSKLNHEIIF